MTYSRKIAERMWNQPDKGELEAAREETYIDDIVQKAHIERELLSNLEGIATAFDGGGGSGRFSILLAGRGVRVTHFDISQPMLDKAKELAESAGVADKITFVRGALEELEGFADRSFDLVMSFDAPVSYTYPHQEAVIGNLVRLARKKIMLSVTSRLGALPYLANPIQKAQFILDDSRDPWARRYLQHQAEMLANFRFAKAACEKMAATGLAEDIAASEQAYDRGGTPWCITYHFMPEELRDILHRNGVKNVSLAGPGAYARTIPHAVLQKIMGDKAQREQFLDFCHWYDSNPYVCGMGKDNLFAKGEIE